MAKLVRSDVNWITEPRSYTSLLSSLCTHPDTPGTSRTSTQCKRIESERSRVLRIAHSTAVSLFVRRGDVWLKVHTAGIELFTLISGWYLISLLCKYPLMHCGRLLQNPVHLQVHGSSSNLLKYPCLGQEQSHYRRSGLGYASLAARDHRNVARRPQARPGSDEGLWHEPRGSNPCSATCFPQPLRSGRRSTNRVQGA